MIIADSTNSAASVTWLNGCILRTRRPGVGDKCVLRSFKIGVDTNTPLFSITAGLSSGKSLRVTIRHGDLELTVEGDVASVIRSFHDFVERVVPAYSLAKSLVANVSLHEMLNSLKDHIIYDDSLGFVLRPTAHALPAPDQVLLFLALRRAEHLMGKRDTSLTNLRELSEGLGLKRGTLTGALSELRKAGLVRRLERGDYEVTQAGLQYLVERFSPRQSG
jgi:DNA-binding transcriptional ArsR family regulator